MSPIPEPEANRTAHPHPALAHGPLTGVRVLEMGQLIAGPFAGCMLAYFGADVVKVEPPDKGDALRDWRVLKNGTSLWWYSMGRNKRSVALDLRQEAGREVARRLATQADVLIENFKPGTLEKWGMGPDDLKATNPNLIYTRISGYGQSGPYSPRPGFASVCEGIGGFRYLNGFPGQTPVRPNLSIGDTLAALHATIGILLALVGRSKTTRGQVVDVAIYEAVFNMLESVVPEYDGAGVVREPSGSTLTGIVPTNTYRCRNGKFVVIGANADSIFKRLMGATGRDDLAHDPRFADNAGRVRHQAELDEAISTWTQSLASDEVLRILEEASVPAGPIYSAPDILADPHFQARGLFHEVEVDGEPLKVPAIPPMLSDTPGQTRWPGPKVGEHTQEVISDWLGHEDKDPAT